jgi:hypothetical protein
MVKVILSGGLGNQIFQYAAGRALALKYSTNLVLNLNLLNRFDSSVTPRSYELGNLRVLCDIELNSPFPMWTWIKKFTWLLGPLNPWKFYQENSSSYDPRLLQQPDGVTLFGYWQSHIYFSDISKQLMSELQPSKPLSEESVKVLDKIESSRAIAIHVRRGDYVSNAETSSFHGLMPLNYYKDAVAYVLAKFPGATFFIFSDDLDWCKKNLNLEQVHFVDHNEVENSWEDLILMSKCRHHIIANSSFSWWAAWMADNNQAVANHLVIAPKNWFNKAHQINNTDRFPQHWILL